MECEINPPLSTRANSIVPSLFDIVLKKSQPNFEPKQLCVTSPTNPMVPLVSFLYIIVCTASLFS